MIVTPSKHPAATDPARAAFCRARTCYKHLAGQLGVAWLAALERQELVGVHDRAIVLSPRGMACFEGLGLSVPSWPTGKACLDGTERRDHLGGALGVLLTQHLFARGWIARREDGRALRVTTVGRSGFAGFGIPA